MNLRRFIIVLGLLLTLGLLSNGCSKKEEAPQTEAQTSEPAQPAADSTQAAMDTTQTAQPAQQ
ncbi:MAG: hypothetical protein ALAOOOJD_02376 [bacterium]|nr:hypothetical protein [bacterium]